VDPSLPPEMMVHRLDERTGLSPGDIDVVFLTTFRPAHRRALRVLEQASWLMHAPEIEAVSLHLAAVANETRQQGSANPQAAQLVRDEQALMGRVRPSPEKLTPQVHLFPTPGPSPGSASLLLAGAARTVMVTGDAVLTQDYFEAGRAFEQSGSIEDAQISFREIAEIADEIVPGHDNVFRVQVC